MDTTEEKERALAGQSTEANLDGGTKEARSADQTEKRHVKRYPIAEIFTSIQGEGGKAGYLTTFIRLAGCSVGRPNAMTAPHETCTRYDGVKFTCDTDFRRTEMLTPEEIVSRLESPHVCITGGEPFDHDLEELVKALEPTKRRVSIETSGTKEIPTYVKAELDVVGGRRSEITFCRITLSPKFGVTTEAIMRADEIKLLVDQDFDLQDALFRFGINKKARVFLQPIAVGSAGDAISKDNTQRCMTLLLQVPYWRLSTQLHKYLGVR